MIVAEEQSFTTHQGREAAELCRLMTFIIVRAINQPDSAHSQSQAQPKASARAFLDCLLSDSAIADAKHVFKEPSVISLMRSRQEGNDPDRNWNWKDPHFRYSAKRVQENSGYMGSYAMDGMAMALHCLYHTDSFDAALLKVVNICGDADSVGSICGQMAGAIYGFSTICKEWIETVRKWDRGCLATRAYKLFHHLRRDEGKVAPSTIAHVPPPALSTATMHPLSSDDSDLGRSVARRHEGPQ